MLSPMNSRTIIAADGLERRAFTVAEVERMVECGILAEDERVELIDGELIPMSPKGYRHELVKRAINMRWARACPAGIHFVPETTLRLSPDTYLEPDFLVYPAGIGLVGIGGERCLLAVEIGASSLGYDLGRKAFVYAGFGLPELWVIDANALVLHVHRDPGPDGYRSVTAHPADATVAPSAAPAAFALCLAELDLSE